MDIGIFVLGAIICQFISLKIMKLRISKTTNSLGLITFILIGCLLFYLPFTLQSYPIFMDSKTKNMVYELITYHQSLIHLTLFLHFSSLDSIYP